MKLRPKTLLLMAATLLGLVVLLFLISYQVMTRSFEALEDAEVAEQTARAQRAVLTELADLDSRCADWAAWDDTYRLAATGNSGFIDRDAGLASLETLGLSGLICLNRQGTVLAAVQAQGEPPALVPLAYLSSYVGPASPLLRVAAERQPRSGIVTTPEGLVLVAAHPIVTSERKGPIAGTLIMTRVLTSARLRKVAGEDVTLVSAPSPDAIPNPSSDKRRVPTPLGLVAIRPLDSTHVNGLIVLPDLTGQRNLLLTATLPRSIYQEGRRNSLYLAASLTTVSVVLITLILIVLEKSVISRITQLRSELQEIAAEGDLTRRVSASGGDEISDLSRAVNATFVSLEQAHADLRESESRFRDVALNLSDWVWEVDANLHYTYSSGSAEQSLGYPLEELLTLGSANHVAPEDLDSMRALMWAIVGERRAVSNLEIRVIAADGSPVYLLVSAVPVHGPTGVFRGFRGVATDITARRTAEENLRRRELILEAVAFAADRFLGRVDWRSCLGEVLEHLGRAAQVEGVAYFENECNEDGELGRRLQEEWILPGTVTTPATGDFQLYPDGSSSWRNALERGEFVLQSVPDSRDDARFDVEHTQSVALFPLFVEGEWRGMLGFATFRAPRHWSAPELDALHAAAHLLSARLQHDHFGTVLRTREQQNAALFEAIPDLIMVLDQEGVIRQYVTPNSPPASLSTPHAYVGRTLGDILPPEAAARGLASVADALLQGTVETFLYTLAAPKDDEQGDRHYEVRVVASGDGEVLAIVRDFTERLRTEEQLRHTLTELQRSNVELEQFAYVASHDLQEPLRMVSNYVELLSERYRDSLGAEADDFIGYAVEGVDRMRQLINDLLDFSRVGTSGRELAPLDPNVVLRTVLNTLKPALTESGAEVICHPLPPLVRADSPQLAQLFQNFLSNALKFRGPEPLRMEISAQRGEGEWVFSVRDNGIGFDADHAESIFIIFRRLHTRREYPGNGMGLAICKKIVERHGGRIWAESAPGQGATFHFTLPAEADELV
ncbi:MAG TPA: CHASE4 domain-containing protein [Armatimonadota bacterium]|jgi:PAS domain S-box-containing protein